MTALDSETGQFLWESLSTADEGITLGADGILYSGGRAVRTGNGERLWEVGNGLRHSLLGPEGTLYGSGGGYQFNALDINKRGRLKWYVPMTTVHPKASLADDGTLFLDNGAAIDALTGTVHWTFRASVGSGGLGPSFTENQLSAPAIDHDGTLYYGGNDGFVYAVRRDASIRWSARLPSSISETPVLLANGSLLVADGQSIWALERSTGVTLWNRNLGQPITGPLNVGPDGTIYAVLQYDLVAVAGDAPLDHAAADWPRHRGDAANTGSRHLPPGPPAIAFVSPSGPAAQGEPLQLTVTAGGTAPLLYQWYRNGVELPGNTSLRLRLDTFTADDAGDYHAVVSNALGTLPSEIVRVDLGNGSREYSHDANLPGRRPSPRCHRDRLGEPGRCLGQSALANFRHHGDPAADWA